MLGKWDEHHVAIRRFGETDESYIKAAEWLGDSVEDWGCGCIWAKQFFKQYRGVDGSGPFCDVRADLTEYLSHGYNILCRHVLEHNKNWRHILANLVASFDKRACIILSIPCEPVERVWTFERDIPYIHLDESTFKSHIESVLHHVDYLSTGETLYYLER